jgi:hypothetical protein
MHSKLLNQIDNFYKLAQVKADDPQIIFENMAKLINESARTGDGKVQKVICDHLIFRSTKTGKSEARGSAPVLMAVSTKAIAPTDSMLEGASNLFGFGKKPALALQFLSHADEQPYLDAASRISYAKSMLGKFGLNISDYDIFNVSTSDIDDNVGNRAYIDTVAVFKKQIKK